MTKYEWWLSLLLITGSVGIWCPDISLSTHPCHNAFPRRTGIMGAYRMNSAAELQSQAGRLEA